MKKVLVILLAVAVVFSVAACSTGGKNAVNSASSAPSASVGASSATSASSAPSTSAASGNKPKIAVMSNLGSSDFSAQWLAGAQAEGQALGYQVDTFLVNQDDVKFQDLLQTTLNKDYVGWIVSHGGAGYSAQCFQAAVNKGIKVISFDSGGDHVPGVTYTSQNDSKLASASLDSLITACQAKGVTTPKIAEINFLGVMVPLDTRHDVLMNDYVKTNKVQLLQTIAPASAATISDDIATGISTLLTKYKPGQIDGIWAAASGIGDMGLFDDMTSAKRTDVLYTSIDISNAEIQYMAKYPYYVSVACVNPSVISTVDVRLLVLKLNNATDVPDTYVLTPVNVTAKDITPDDTMQTLGAKNAGFGTTKDFDTDLIEKLRSANAGK